MLGEKKWYAVHAFSGCEYQVAQDIKEKIKTNKMEHIFGKILIPSEEIISIKKGKQKKIQKKFFPGYILIQMIMNKNSWHIIKNFPKVLGFIGTSLEKPTPISDQEIKNILSKIKKNKKKPKPKNIFQPGSCVRVNHGPFIDFHGTVETVDYEKNRLKISISIFGRSTPVELNFQHVEKSNV